MLPNALQCLTNIKSVCCKQVRSDKSNKTETEKVKKGLIQKLKPSKCRACLANIRSLCCEQACNHKINKIEKKQSRKKTNIETKTRQMLSTFDKSLHKK